MTSAPRLTRNSGDSPSETRDRIERRACPLRPQLRTQGARPQGARRVRVRVPRPQRRGQDHHDPFARRARAPRRRHGQRARPRHEARGAARPAPHRVRARAPAPLQAAHGRGVDPLPRHLVSHVGRDVGGAAPRRLPARARHRRGSPLQGRNGEAHDSPRARAAPRAPRARRADRWPGSGGAARRVVGRARLRERNERDRVHLESPDSRARAHLRLGRHP